MPKMTLFQFWNTDKGPDEVEELLASWSKDPAFDYHRFNTESAAAFIERNFDQRTLFAYRACGVPAMQADFFRYCVLYIKGGVYVDADTQNSNRLPELLQNRERGLLMMRETRVANDFLFVRNEKDPLYLLVIGQMVKNIEGQISNNVWEVTGPGIMTKLYHGENSRSAFKNFEFEMASVVREYVLFKHDLAYKKTADDWRSNLGTEKKSIFLSQ